jgi:hypothetical protein
VINDSGDRDQGSRNDRDQFFVISGMVITINLECFPQDEVALDITPGNERDEPCGSRGACKNTRQQAMVETETSATRGSRQCEVLLYFSDFPTHQDLVGFCSNGEPLSAVGK